MSDKRSAIEERAFDSIPRVTKDHLRAHRKQWVGSQRRAPESADEAGALAIVVLIGGDRLALFADQGELLRVVELDR